MTKKYRVTLDVTMSGDVYIDAESEDEAIEKARETSYFSYELRDFHFLSSNVFDVEEVEEGGEGNA